MPSGERRVSLPTCLAVSPAGADHLGPLHEREVGLLAEVVQLLDVRGARRGGEHEGHREGERECAHGLSLLSGRSGSEIHSAIEPS